LFSLVYEFLNRDADVLVQLLILSHCGPTSHRIMLTIEAAMKENIIGELTAAARFAL
jgi:hypothetical protein